MSGALPVALLPRCALRESEQPGVVVGPVPSLVAGMSTEWRGSTYASDARRKRCCGGRRCGRSVFRRFGGGSVFASVLFGYQVHVPLLSVCGAPLRASHDGNLCTGNIRFGHKRPPSVRNKTG